jgi:hypothetical protein
MPLLHTVYQENGGGERYCEVGRCVFETNSMPLLQIALAVTAVVKSIAIN